MTRSLTVQCLVGLALGVLVGAAMPHGLSAGVKTWIGVADFSIRLWTNGLQVVVTPLVIAQLYVAIAEPRAGIAGATRLGLVIPAVFTGLLVFTGLCASAVGAGLLTLPLFRGLSLTSPSAVAGSLASGGTTAISWADALIPHNLFSAAASDAILGLMIVTLAFALAARRLELEQRQALKAGFTAVRDVMFVLVGWLLRIAPLVLFALAFRSAADSGLEIGRVLLIFAGLSIVVLLVCIAALYPVAVLLGGIPPARFARALFPAQVTAAASRSSLATVPALLKGAETELGIEPRISSLVLPLGGALLKLSAMVSSPLKLLFLARVLGFHFGVQQLLVFAIAILFLSVSTAGVPNIQSASRSLPAFVAAGVPVEYVLLLGSTTALTDVFLTVLNTTGYMTANVLVGRLAGRSPAA